MCWACECLTPLSDVLLSTVQDGKLDCVPQCVYGHPGLLKDCKCLFLYDTHELTFSRGRRVDEVILLEFTPTAITTAIRILPSRPAHPPPLAQAAWRFTQQQLQSRTRRGLWGSEISPKLLLKEIWSHWGGVCKSYILQVPAVQCKSIAVGNKQTSRQDHFSTTSADRKNLFGLWTWIRSPLPSHLSYLQMLTEEDCRNLF